MVDFILQNHKVFMVHIILGHFENDSFYFPPNLLNCIHTFLIQRIL